MSNDKVMLPSSTAGIAQYHDAYHSSWVIRPGHVIIFSVIVALLVLALHATGGRFV